MKTIDIAEMDQLSGYLQAVKDGEEIVIAEHSVPVARLVPAQKKSRDERVAELVASGAIKMPQQKMDWDKFFASPAGDVPYDVAVQAAIDSRGDR